MPQNFHKNLEPSVVDVFSQQRDEFFAATFKFARKRLAETLVKPRHERGLHVAARIRGADFSGGRSPIPRLGSVLKSDLSIAGLIAGGETGVGKSGVRFSFGHRQQQRLRPLLPRPDTSGPSAPGEPENPRRRLEFRDWLAGPLSKALAAPSSHVPSLYTRIGNRSQDQY